MLATGAFVLANLLLGAAATPVLLQDVTLIDGSGGPPQSHRDVLLSEGRIERIGAHGKIVPKADVARLDLSGRYLLPGFFDLHVHVLLHSWDEEGHIRPRGDPSTASRFLRLLLAHGVTTIRDPGDETEAAVALRRLVADGQVVGPRILTAGRILNASPFRAEPFAPVATPDDVRREIERQAAAGVDAVKVYSAMPPALVGAAIEESHRRGLPVLGHLERTTWTEAADLGIDAIEHSAPWSPVYLPESARGGVSDDLYGRVAWLERIDPVSAPVNEMIRALVTRGVVVDPTVIAMHSKLFGDDPIYRNDPDQRLLPAMVVRGWLLGSFTARWTPEQYARAHAAWPKVKAWIQRLYEGRVSLTVGTDAPTPWIVPGPSVHREMALLNECGIPASAVLEMATANAARALKLDQEVGTIRVGLRADLVVLKANPLDDIRNTRTIEMVFQGGVPLRPADLLAENAAP